MRKARALCPDGKLRSFRVGIADTFFTIPARTRIGRVYVKGYVYVDGDTLRFSCASLMTTSKETAIKGKQHEDRRAIR